MNKEAVKTMKRQQFIDMVNGFVSPVMFSMDVKTEVDMRKTGNPFIGTTKTNTVSGCLNGDYESMVNRELVREGKEAEFVAQPRKWGKWENNWIVHNGKYYLQLKVQSTGTPTYEFGGQVIEKTVLEPFMPQRADPKTQEDVEKKIILRDYKLENVQRVRLMGEVIEFED